MSDKTTQSAEARRGDYCALYVPVGEIARLPGLARLSQLLGVRAKDKVRSVSRVTMDGVFDCGGKVKQLVCCAEEFRGSSCDHYVVYKLIANSSQRCVGELRAIIRQDTGYRAVIMETAPFGAENGCQLAARGCQHWRWQK
eukprot:TRINITY_DN6947_c0_g1_i1.p2 TRINITY_DN6947_c0_g1~~TRINITY_DN6947_c0_g1_i1.p2  ORF type:complete len:141 (+),score=26.42 TRINITY_DN6947_c0_g1_i1:1228-1650(+)